MKRIIDSVSKFNQTDTLEEIYRYRLQTNYYRNDKEYNSPFLINLIINNLQEYNPQVLSSTLNGNICCRLNRAREQGVPMQLSGLVDTLYKSNSYWDIADYLIMVVKRLLREKPYLLNSGNELKLKQALYITIGRGLVTFPSAMREIDLSEKLLLLCPELIIKRNPSQDIHEHTDLKVIYNNNEYLLWSYVMTQTNISKTYDKVIGKKGKLPNGKHFLIPFVYKTGEKINNWGFHTMDEVQQVLNRIKNNETDISYQDFLVSKEREQQCAKSLIILK